MNIEVSRVTKHWGRAVGLDDVSLRIEPGELVALLGPSGSGKSTLLRVIAGLESPERGSISFAGVDATHLPVRDRGVGFVFQHYALFRHLTVFENVAFGLRVLPRKQRPRPAVLRQRVEELLALVQLDGLAGRLPGQLSGGQRQRVALARALAVEPRVLLLDEPFAALDAKVRDELRRWLRRLHDELHITSVLVTHDQEEALEVADRVVVMNAGRVEQIGTPAEILDSPASAFVTEFVGEVNALPATVQGGRARIGPLAVAAPDLCDGAAARVLIRAYDLKLWRDPAGVATVERVTPLGDRVKIAAVLDGVGPIHAHFPRRSSLLAGIEPGCRVAVEVTLARVYPAAELPARRAPEVATREAPLRRSTAEAEAALAGAA
jgi:sulfate transport system ATP-binding protein